MVQALAILSNGALAVIYEKELMEEGWGGCALESFGIDGEFLGKITTAQDCVYDIDEALKYWKVHYPLNRKIESLEDTRAKIISIFLS